MLLLSCGDDATGTDRLAAWWDLASGSFTPESGDLTTQSLGGTRTVLHIYKF